MKIIKKAASYIIAFILIFSLNGCFNSKKPAAPVSGTADETKKSSDAGSFKTYSNSKFGYSVSYPDIYTKETESDNEDGISMESADKLYIFEVWGGYNVVNNSGYDLMEVAKERVSHIISDYADDHVYKLEYGGGDETPIIFYEYGYVSDDIELGFIISYPEKERAKYNEIVKQMISELTNNAEEVKKTDSDEKAVSDKDDDFTYSIMDQMYTEDGVTIKFPQLIRSSNPAKADSINKAIQESIRKKLDSLRSGEDGMGALTLDLNYEISGYGNKVLSISYQGYVHFKEATYPSDVYHTQNIELGDIHTLALKDIFTIDDFFVEQFKSGMYSPSGEDLDLEKSGVDIKDEIERLYSNKDLIRIFEQTDVNYKLTEYGVILSIEVPHVLGDHLEMAINYEAIEVNMIKSSPVWENYPFLNME